MTTKPPPVFYFPGIAFNSGYYTIIDEAPLTESKADSRYLIKTQKDTTNNLQTFLGGISCGGTLSAGIITTNGIAIGNPLSSFSFLNNQTTTLSIGSNIGRTGNINISNTQTTGTGNIVLGSTSITTGSQNIIINRPLTIGYTDNPSLSQLGGTTFITATSQSFGTTGSSKTLAVLNVIPIGIYQVFYNITTTITVLDATITENTTSLSNTSDNTTVGTTLNFIRDSDLILINRFVGYNFTKSGSGILLNTTSSASIYLNQRLIYTSGPTIISAGHLRIVRIG